MKPKIVVLLSEGGIPEVHVLGDMDSVDVVILDYSTNENPGVIVADDIFEDTPQDFNELIGEAIEKIKDSIEEVNSDDELNSDVEEWRETVEYLEEFKVK